MILQSSTSHYTVHPTILVSLLTLYRRSLQRELTLACPRIGSFLLDYTGSISERGGPDARDLNINYPLPLGTDNEAYLETLEKGIKDISRFDPEMVFVS